MRSESLFLRATGIAIAVAIGTLPVPVRAGDWPQWRGAGRDAVWNETGLLESFPPEGLTIRWRQPIGYGWSSPVIAAGRVFATDALVVQPTAQERVHCFDEATGEPLWTYAYDVAYPDWAFVPGQEGGPSATPLVEADRVYALGGNGTLVCLEAATGQVVWKRSLDKDYEIEVWRCRASPLVDGDRLIVFTGAKPGASVMALDKHTGREVWKALDEPVSNSSPLVIEAGGTRQLIVWTEQSVTSLDPATGNTWWRERMMTSNNDAIASPVFADDLLLIGGLMFELDRAKPAATILWPKTKAVARRVLSNTSTALLEDGHVYSARSSGEFVCLDARTGEEVWRTDQVTDLMTGASIHVTRNGDSALLYNERGELIRARLSPEGYQERSRARLIEPTYAFGGRKCAWSPPAYANRHVFARTDQELVCASLAAGE
jgi:outer membrane protein assembly factor BamB